MSSLYLLYNEAHPSYSRKWRKFGWYMLNFSVSSSKHSPLQRLYNEVVQRQTHIKAATFSSSVFPASPIIHHALSMLVLFPVVLLFSSTLQPIHVRSLAASSSTNPFCLPLLRAVVTSATSQKLLAMSHVENVDGVVFDPNLTKPDVLVLQNLVADIREYQECDEQLQRRRDKEGSGKEKGSTKHSNRPWRI